MTLEQFAQHYRLKIKKDDCDGEIIVGKLLAGCGPDRPSAHHHVYLHDDSRLAVYLNFPTKQRWNTARKALLAAGARELRVAECDGILAFDPDDEALVRLVIRIARLRVKRQLTEEQKAEIKKRFKK